MKERNGFVSNSSSTSFVIRTEADRAEADRAGMERYKISDIILRMMPLIELGNELRNGNVTGIPYFIMNDCWIPESSYYEDLIKLEEATPGCELTDPFDRDRASQLNINLESFAGDL